MKRKIIIPIFFVALLILTTIIPVHNVFADESQEKTITFNDENLCKDVKHHLNSNNNKIPYKDGELENTIIMTQENIDKVTSLFIVTDEVTDIGGIENFTNLNHLQLNKTKVSDISKLSALTKLTDLKLSDTQVTDISVLGTLTKLKSLTLDNDNISSMEPLKNLTSLETLSLNNTNISDINFLSGLTKLKQLYLKDNKISSIEPLINLKDLTELYLSNNKISDISVLSNLKDKFEHISIVTLNLNNNQISDISVLADFTYKLHNLYLKNNKIGDFSVLDNELKNVQNFYYYIDSQTLEIQSSNRTVSLPKVFLQAQDSNSKLYTAQSFELKDCTLSEDKKSVVVNENVKTATVKITDAKAKDTILTITIVDPLELSLSKTPEEMTKGNVKATITSNKVLDPKSIPEGWTLSEDRKSVTKEYEKNVDEEVVTLTDLDGLTDSVEVTVDNIDKEAPLVDITQKENEDGSIEVTLKSNEPVKEVEGWKLSDDKMTLTKTYTKTTEEELGIQDLVGNETKVQLKVTVKANNKLEENKQNNDNKQTLNNSNAPSNSNNLSNQSTPNTGDSILIYIVISILALSIIVITNIFIRRKKQRKQGKQEKQGKH